jgi:hypothetical protein
MPASKAPLIAGFTECLVTENVLLLFGGDGDHATIEYVS